MMNMTKFEKLLAVYGADPARWPEADTSEANESLLRARPVKKARFRLPEFSFGGSWLPAGGLVAITAAVALIVYLPHQRHVPQTQEVAEVGSFIQTLDQFASKTDNDIKDTDEVLAMLDAAQPAQPQTLPDGNGVTSDELMKTLFDDDKPDDNSNL
jgi:hypothetical protein